MYKDNIFIPIGDAAEALLFNANKTDCISTGIKSVDEITGGLKKGGLVLLAARPGMGKTQFCMNIAYNAAKATGRKSVFCTYENSAEQIAARAVWMLTGVHPCEIKNNEDSYLDEGLRKAAKELQDIDIQVFQGYDLIEPFLEKLKGVDNLGLVVIDYLQICSLGSKFASRAEEKQKLLLVFKQAAHELGVPIIVISQVTRECEYREDKRPIISDLFIENVDILADDIIFLYKDSYYHEGNDDDNTCECIVAKSRDHSSGVAELRLENNGGKYTDIE